MSQPLLLDTLQQSFYCEAMRLGGRLKLAREKRGLTQQQLAERASSKDAPISQAALSALEKRDSETTIWLFQLSKTLAVRPEWLQNGIEPSGLELDAPIMRDAAIGHYAPSDAEKLFLLVRSFLDTDDEGRSALVKAATSITKAYGTARANQPRRAKRR